MTINKSLKFLAYTFIIILIASCGPPKINKFSPKVVIYNGLDEAVKVHLNGKKLNVKPKTRSITKFPRNYTFEISTTVGKDTLEIFEIRGEEELTYIYNVDSAATLVEIPIEYGSVKKNNYGLELSEEDQAYLDSFSSFSDADGNEIVPGVPEIIGNDRWFVSTASYFFEDPPETTTITQEYYMPTARTLKWVIYDAMEFLESYEADSVNIESGLGF